jgi:hypothetical protein
MSAQIEELLGRDDGKQKSDDANQDPSRRTTARLLLDWLNGLISSVVHGKRSVRQIESGEAKV